MKLRDINFKAQYYDQQQALREICSGLGLKMYYPNYHQKKGDANTILIYFAEDWDYNAGLDVQEKKLGYLPGDYRQAVCHLENTDCNNRLDMKFMNHGTLDLRALDWKDKLKTYIQERVDFIRKLREE